METLFLTPESDPELGRLVLTANQPAQSGIDIKSARDFIHFGDSKAVLEIGTALLALLKVILELRKAGSQTESLPKQAREKIEEECARIGLADTYLTDLHLTRIEGRNAIQATIHCKFYDAEVTVDDLDNITFCKVRPAP